MRRLLVLGLILVLGSRGAEAAERDEAANHLDWIEVVEIESPASWKGMQWVATDRRGDAYLLRSESLEVFPLLPDGTLDEEVEPVALEPLGLPGPAFRRAAAMGAEPDDWVVVEAGGWRFFLEGEEEKIERPNQPLLGLTLAGGDPVALLGPTKIRRERGEAFDRLPTLARWAGDEWDEVFEESLEDLDDADGIGGRTARNGVLVADREGDLWLASLYLPRLRHISSTGRELLEITVGAVEPVEQSAAAIGRMRERLEKKRIAPDADRSPAVETVGVVRALSLHRAVAVARDGTVYVLAVDPADTTTPRLRRWDPVRFVYEEVALPIDLPGMASLAVGRDGLHLAQWNPGLGRAFLPFESLEAAAWKEVEGARIDGVSASVDEP